MRLIPPGVRVDSWMSSRGIICAAGAEATTESSVYNRIDLIICHIK